MADRPTKGRETSWLAEGFCFDFHGGKESIHAYVKSNVDESLKLRVSRENGKLTKGTFSCQIDIFATLMNQTRSQ